VPLNETDHYLPYETGKKLDVFMKNPNGSIYIGEVWPGVFFVFLFL
jgi:alpha-glucosidase